MNFPAQSNDSLLLTDAYVSYTATRDHHWNITGAESRHLHQQFQAQFEKTGATRRTLVKPQP